MIIIANMISNMIRQTRIGTDKPEKDVRIEQELHLPSNSAKMSSGNGASKSSGTVNSPAHKP